MQYPGAQAAMPVQTETNSVSGRQQGPFVILTEEVQQRFGKRRFADAAVALPPHPCMLCDAAFGREEDWFQHVAGTHEGMQCYRQRLAYLCEQFDAVGRVTPQLWRHSIEAWTEEYVTGSVDWGCLHLGWNHPVPAAETARWLDPKTHGGELPLLSYTCFCECSECLAQWLRGRSRPWESLRAGTTQAEFQEEAHRVLVAVEVKPVLPGVAVAPWNCWPRSFSQTW